MQWLPSSLNARERLPHSEPAAGAGLTALHAQHQTAGSTFTALHVQVPQNSRVEGNEAQ
jgi:hypothetical protein